MLSEIIKTRRSVYPVLYNDDPITKEEIQQILEAANWAPTHKKTEPWRFKVFYGESLKTLSDFLGKKYEETAENFSEFKQKQIKEKVLQSGCIIAICMQRDPKESLPEWEEIAAVAMAVQNMWLMAHDMGIGAYWSSPALMNYLNELTPMNKGEKCFGFFYMGKYDQNALVQLERKTQIEEKTTWV